MNMKLLYKSFLLLTVITLVSCNDFLTVLPDSSYSVEGGYQKQIDFEQAIAGVYAAHQALYSQTLESPMYMLVLRADETNVITPLANIGYLGGIERFIDDANNATHSKNYAAHYKIINRCNVILDKIDAVPFTDEATKKYIKGEALAFRAYSYWMLGSWFGGVPLIKKVTTVAETKMIARSTQAETFASAGEDFTAAIALLPSVKWTGKYLGRITKYSAMGMQARMYMFTKEYTKAKPLLETIISSGLYSMEADYKNCFSESKENGPERLWELQYMGGQLGEGEQFTSGLMPSALTDPIQPFSGNSTVPVVSADMISAYEAGDLRKDASIITGLKWSGIVDNSNYFIRKYHYADVYTPKTQSDWGINLPILRYTDVKLMYAEVLNEEAYSATGEAFNIINQVRARAKLAPLTSATTPDKTAFRNAIMKERRVEFAFEGLRWMDITRWGIAMDVMNAKLSKPIQDGGRYIMKSHQTLFPIPFDELNRYQDDKVMWQNPGY
jgi:hypothetical protein